jgi:hypothetical protein
VGFLDKNRAENSDLFSCIRGRAIFKPDKWFRILLNIKRRNKKDGICEFRNFC